MSTQLAEHSKRHRQLTAMLGMLSLAGKGAVFSVTRGHAYTLNAATGDFLLTGEVASRWYGVSAAAGMFFFSSTNAIREYELTADTGGLSLIGGNE